MEVHDRARFEPHLAASSSNTPAQIEVAELGELVIEAADRPKGRDIADEAMCLSVVNGGSRQPAALAVGHASEAEFLVEVIDTLPAVHVLEISSGVHSVRRLEDQRHHDRGCVLAAKPFAAPIKPSGIGDEIRVEQVPPPDVFTCSITMFRERPGREDLVGEDEPHGREVRRPRLTPTRIGTANYRDDRKRIEALVV